ncbi:MAG: nicotinamide mononucleotide transporter family protein [Amoebophilaceae bacterium]|nr:nicotinamide mononucleotide transporter family protein [Amoebophilaceae bacterium]
MSFASILDMVTCFYKQHQRTIHEVIVLLVSLTAHLFDARQSILARMLMFPHLIHNVYVYSLRGLYGKVLYSMVVIFLNGYAYVKWKGSKHKPPIQVDKTTDKMRFLFILLGFGSSFFYVLIMYKYFNGVLSRALYCDAFYLVFGLVEKWFMSHKKLERWILACLRYLVFAVACYDKGSMILTIQHILLVFIAVYGQIKWFQSYQTRAKSPLPLS